MNHAYLVQWTHDNNRCIEVFRDRSDAARYANNIPGALVTCVAVRGSEYVDAVFGAPA